MKAKSVMIFDEDILAVCAYILEEQGFMVYTFSDCKAIIEKVGNLLPDVILMDNQIPDSGGLAATQKLKSTAVINQIPVIYFSANSDIEVIAQQAGADAWLAKPFDLEALEAIINSVLS